MRHARLLFVPLFFLAALPPTPARAQNARAVLSGRVVNPSGAVLQGAQVIVQPVNLSLQSDQQGDFTVRDLNTGTYHVIVSYVGFQLFEQDCTRRGGSRHPCQRTARRRVAERVDPRDRRSGRAAKRKRSTARAPRTTSCRCCRPK